MNSLSVDVVSNTPKNINHFEYKDALVLSIIEFTIFKSMKYEGINTKGLAELEIDPLPMIMGLLEVKKESSKYIFDNHLVRVTPSVPKKDFNKNYLKTLLERHLNFKYYNNFYYLYDLLENNVTEEDLQKQYKNYIHLIHFDNYRELVSLNPALNEILNIKISILASKGIDANTLTKQFPVSMDSVNEYNFNSLLDCIDYLIENELVNMDSLNKEIGKLFKKFTKALEKEDVGDSIDIIEKEIDNIKATYPLRHQLIGNIKGFFLIKNLIEYPHHILAKYPNYKYKSKSFMFSEDLFLKTLIEYIADKVDNFNHLPRGTVLNLNTNIFDTKILITYKDHDKEDDSED